MRLNRDVDFKVFGGKDTLLYASLCVGAVGGVCTAGNFMPELIGDVYEKYVSGDREGSLEAQFKLNPVRLAMDGASFPVAANFSSESALCIRWPNYWSFSFSFSPSNE